jgi:CheY-like chemotaxis protein
MAATKGPVLVVDDDSDFREAIRDTLAAEGYAAILVGDGQAALDYLRSNPAPPLILLDWNMAPMNGAQFKAAVAEDPVLSRIPVVLFTADFRASQKVKTGGFVGHLMKPVDLGELFEIIGRYCG